MNEYESLSHTTWDCKYHVVFIPKCRRKTLYQERRRHLGEVPQACASEGIEGRGRASDARSRAHAAIDPAEIRGVAGGGLRDPHGRGLWRAQTQFRGAAFLGPGILRQHGRARRRSHPRVHPQSREGRSEAGADEPLALTSRLGRLQIQGAASATPSAASSGSNPKAPGFAGGYLQPVHSHREQRNTTAAVASGGPSPPKTERAKSLPPTHSARILRGVDLSRFRSPHVRDRIDELADVMSQPADPQSVIEAIRHARSESAHVSRVQATTSKRLQLLWERSSHEPSVTAKRLYDRAGNVRSATSIWQGRVTCRTPRAQRACAGR